MSNAAVRLENNETAVDNRREATLLQLQTAQHKKIQELTQIDMEVHGRGQER
jgi:hypothetical protein